MKRYSLILKITLSVGLIVLSVAVPVNHGLAGRTGTGVSHVADGVPLPPPVPPRGASVQVADGVPLPPPVPPRGASVQVADGVPLPPPVPPRGASVQVADGVPLPPPIPPQLKNVVV